MSEEIKSKQHKSNDEIKETYENKRKNSEVDDDGSSDDEDYDGYQYDDDEDENKHDKQTHKSTQNETTKKLKSDTDSPSKPNESSTQSITSPSQSQKPAKIQLKLGTNVPKPAAALAGVGDSNSKLISSSITTKPAVSAALTGKESASNTASSGCDKLTGITAKLPSGNLAPSKKQAVVGVVKSISENVAKVFGSDDDDDNETEMPFEAKMKMRNLGRNTPTSQGPNSYGKTNLGFCDQRKLFEKQLKEKADQLLKENGEVDSKK